MSVTDWFSFQFCYTNSCAFSYSLMLRLDRETTPLASCRRGGGGASSRQLAALRAEDVAGGGMDPFLRCRSSQRQGHGRFERCCGSLLKRTDTRGQGRRKRGEGSREKHKWGISVRPFFLFWKTILLKGPVLLHHVGKRIGEDAVSNKGGLRGVRSRLRGVELFVWWRQGQHHHAPGREASRQGLL